MSNSAILKPKSFMDLSPILEWEMDDYEARAFKCALIWQRCCDHFFPDEPCSKLRKTGDPRKSYLFKCCYKLVRDTESYLEKDNLKLFIYAQCEMLKGITNGEYHADINPNCLTSGGAWKRWRIWEHKYNEVKKWGNANLKTKTTLGIVKREVNRSVNYLKEVYEGLPTAADLKHASENHTFLRWVHCGKVSPYFIVLCEHVDSNQSWGIDVNVYLGDMPDDAAQWFREEYQWE